MISPRALTFIAVAFLCSFTAGWTLLGNTKQGIDRRNPDAARNEAASSSAVKKPGTPSGLRVLILGDSMSLCGFGKRLDQKLRGDPKIEAIFTYMACGATPLSWLKEPPFTEVKTFCGFWSIESVAGTRAPKEIQDTYATRAGESPTAETIPKLPDLLTTVDPDILVVQSDTNLLSLFRDGKTLLPRLHGRLLSNYITPFLAAAVAGSSNVKKIYWVGSPRSARVSEQIQSFVLERIRTGAPPELTVIDSRQLIPNPHGNMKVDNEHFMGVEMDDWADEVFALIDRDLPAISLIPRDRPKAKEQRSSGAEPSRAPRPRPVIQLRARLAFTSKPLELSQVTPYQESLVGYVYDVIDVLKGTYPQNQVLVMHPAHLRRKRQPLDQYHVGEIYDLTLTKIEGTPWETVKARDESENLSLEPYIRVEDEALFPGATPSGRLGRPE